MHANPDAARLTRATGELATAATKRMEETLPWFRGLGAEERSWVSLVAQAGITALIDWFASPGDRPGLTADVFGAAPRHLARVISLEQTVDLVRTTVGVVEESIDALATSADRPDLRLAILRYSREIAFSAAEVYARAAEARGAWDARLEALVVDALLRDEVDDSVLGRVAALGWSAQETVIVIAGAAPVGDAETALDVLRRAAAHHELDLLTGIHGTTLLAVVGRGADLAKAARLLAPHFGPGPVVTSDPVPGLAQVPGAARSALAGLRAAWGWADAPRPVASADLLPERALAGDPVAAAELVATVHRPLLADAALYDTAATYLERVTSLEATARALFIHPNTVRYRLRRIADLTGHSPTDARGAFTLRVGLTLGRLAGEDLPE
ncbi:MAG: PucR family transcriptional regulator [Candidatus Nanopelagicales bacterium]